MCPIRHASFNANGPWTRPACKAGCAITGNAGCWDLVHKLLTQGVTSEACVKYYYEQWNEFQVRPLREFLIGGTRYCALGDSRHTKTDT